MKTWKLTSVYKTKLCNSSLVKSAKVTYGKIHHFLKWSLVTVFMAATQYLLVAQDHILLPKNQSTL